MASGSGPQRDLSGLVLDLDFGNTKLYAGIGTTARNSISNLSAEIKYGPLYAGQWNGSINFDNENDFIIINNFSDIQLSSGTVYCWVKTSIDTPFFKALITKNNSYGIFLRNGYPLVIDWATGIEYQHTSSIADGKWHYITLTFDSGVSNGSKLYIDGEIALTFTLTVGNQYADLYIGGTGYVPGINKKGLIFNVDANNLKSYPGTGNTWYDLSGYDRHVTLYNSPVFDNSSGGAITFDGVNEYGEATKWGVIGGTSSYTVTQIFKKQNNNDQIWFSFGTGTTSRANQIGIGSSIIGALNFSNSNAFETSNIIADTWNSLSTTYNGTVQKVYFNGVRIKQKTTSLNVGSSNLFIGKSNIQSQFSSVKLGSVQVYNRELSQDEITQNYLAYKNVYINTLGARTMGTFADPAPSGLALAMSYPTLTSGYYWIKSASMPNALNMYVDMSNEGGGFDYYVITGGTSVAYSTDTHSGIVLGLDLVYPRSRDHWKSMYEFVTNVLGSSYGTYIRTTGAVYRVGGIGNYTSYAMRDPNSYESGAPDWRVTDGGRWFIRDSPYSEPNGNYTNYGFLGLQSMFADGTITGFDDGGAFSTGTSYLVSTNAKP